MTSAGPKLEKLLVTAIIVILAAPLPLTILTHYCNQLPRSVKIRIYPWLHYGELAGVEATPSASSSLSWKAVYQAKWQQAVASRFDRGFAMRKFFIRMSNEAYFRLFRVCAMNSSEIVVGRGDSLLQTWYAQ